MHQPLSSRQGSPLQGAITPPGDKSISHRAIMLGGIANGETTITGLLEGKDVLHTIAALRALGIDISKTPDGAWHVHGKGAAGLSAPSSELDMGNSGTAARLLIGLLSGQPFISAVSGDASLSKRPMERIITPLTQMGAKFESINGRLPLKVTGSNKLMPITYKLPIASAQVKSAILLAGLGADGVTTVIEPIPTRDHSENMLRYFGARVDITRTTDGDAIKLTGKPQLRGRAIAIPADPSSAAFPMVAALIRAGSRIEMKNVGINPRRAGLIDTLIEMGGKVELSNKRDECGEPVADIVVTGSALKGITVPAERAPSMIDEYPILAIAASSAGGTTRMLGLGELRVKESDRLALMADGLKRCGVNVEIQGDDLIVHGNGKPPQGGATIETAMDHRIAMSFLVLGSMTQQPITIDDGSFIATSFPDFIKIMNGAGMHIDKTEI